MWEATRGKRADNQVLLAGTAGAGVEHRDLVVNLEWEVGRGEGCGCDCREW